MLLSSEYDNMKQLVIDLKINDHDLLEYTKKIKAHGHYKNLYIRIANDIKNCISPKIICELYDKYNCNDMHISTLFKTIVKDLYPVTFKYINENVEKNN